MGAEIWEWTGKPDGRAPVRRGRDAPREAAPVSTQAFGMQRLLFFIHSISRAWCWVRVSRNSV